jgi:hypothetical protein
VEEVKETHPREVLIGQVLKSLRIEKTLADKKVVAEVKAYPTLKHMFEVAPDDVVVEEQPRQLRTETTSVTSDVDEVCDVFCVAFFFIIFFECVYVT